MGSPIVQPLFSTVTLTKRPGTSVYLQLAGALTAFIKRGDLKAGERLPSTRQLAEFFNLHRKTVIRAYDDLLAQGWLASETGNGTFVSARLPDVGPPPLLGDHLLHTGPGNAAGFSFEPAPHLHRKPVKSALTYHLDDGYPDTRLAPLHDLSRAYRTQLLAGNSYHRLGYTDPQGSLALREELGIHLNTTRSLKLTADNILVTRGSVMGLYLAAAGLLKRDDIVICGSPGYIGADMNFIHAGARLIQIPVDAYGLDIAALEKICKTQPVRLVYVTSHHHYPTTVALRAGRRIELLRLSENYGFIIFEDDYDYDFHYLNSPLLPLASADPGGRVIYCGSFTKTISPAFRVGYLVGPVDVIRHLTTIRRIIDRQGDTMLENAMAELLRNGIIQRHLRKSVRVYRQRRDQFCGLLTSELSDYISFSVPDGGMSVWGSFDPKIDLALIAKEAARKDMFVSDGQIHQSAFGSLNATRLGFASSSAYELEQCVEILTSVLKRR